MGPHRPIATCAYTRLCGSGMWRGLRSTGGPQPPLGVPSGSARDAAWLADFSWFLLYNCPNGAANHQPPPGVSLRRELATLSALFNTQSGRVRPAFDSGRIIGVSKVVNSKYRRHCFLTHTALLWCGMSLQCFKITNLSLELLASLANLIWFC